MSFAEVAEALERSRAGERQEALASGDGVSGAPFARWLKQALPAAPWHLRNSDLQQTLYSYKPAERAQAAEGAGGA